MLILSLSAVARGEVRIEGEIPADDPVLEDTGLAPAEPPRVALTATQVGEGVLVRGRIDLRLDVQCRRCLVGVPIEAEVDVEVLYEPLDVEEEVELSGEVYPLPARGDELDLRPALREQVLLHAPEYVLCREQCRGLCPQCGIDLNRESCSCVPEAAPSPWDALKNVKFD